MRLRDRLRPNWPVIALTAAVIAYLALVGWVIYHVV